ncbi:MAG TPA: helix-turn-helix transcriptional regulator [Candidatus Caccousia stercoris]|uniref:Helix-turn-helix transcriptional regulator n=2 Tax=Candidatus Caccousia stercoris TaxID=2840723 RepID=A0A9D1K0P2_9FIRM|nr:helix-turn-helix transcriptional regulator [Candidatus Caccousia stercoris]
MRENASLWGTAVSPEIPAGRWRELLLDGRTQELCWECAAQARRLAGKEDREGFYHDFSQMLYTLLERCGVAAHCLLAEMKKEGAPPEPCADAESLEKWISGAVRACRTCLTGARREESAVGTVCRYIEEHLPDHLSRDELASVAYLSPDRLSHLFTEKMGVSLTAYIAGARIRRAKELLQGCMSVRDVALASGFQNISYFSRQFKQSTGMTPQEYRKGGLRP